MTTSYRALVVTEDDSGQFKQTVSDLPFDNLPDNDVLIKVHYSSLNYKDAMSAFGNKGVTRQYPHTPGIDAAGVVISDRSGNFTEHNKVLVFGYDLGMNTPGGLAEYICVPANWVVPCPTNVSLSDAMIYGTGGLTAALCIEKLLTMGAKPSDGPVAVTGATGGVGSISVALLHKLGFEVIAFSGKDDTSLLLKLGANEVLHRDRINDIGDKPLGKGLYGHAIDTLGGDYLANLVKQLKPNGGVAACGLAASASFSLNVFPFITRGVSILGVDSVNIPLTEKARMWELVADKYALADIHMLATTISLDQVIEVLPKFFNGQVTGRYLVSIGAEG
ncbi:YhdH/YhfP family quinone oxidoreductase [Thalassotalea ponticola]|uniref:YhdH/YhfP family quinone oxidoreductase n=1 Tax=Thalassotalea ponticola TaxID=1523392 RepID=UPI0025B47758|nr:YhdH/YhfP family quinone oxidoreductase [Thalassotalea ponticola]MDN3651586.1 YhdH/YhfP family quinone oxidoreductase [Thalassotalea ponticola]